MTPQEEAQGLAREIMELSRATLLTELRFLAPALCKMPLVDDPTPGGLATEGQAIHYSFLYVLRRWQADRPSVIRSLLHLVLHCLYHHPFMDADAMLPACWDLACDIAVERVIDEMDLPSLRLDRGEAAKETMAQLDRALKGKLTAERIYRYFADSGLREQELHELRAPFQPDEHDLWYQHARQRDEQRSKAGEGNGGSDGDGEGQRDKREQGEDSPAGGQKTEASSGDGNADPAAAQAARDWQKIAAQVQADLEAHSRQWADRAGSMLINLKQARRSRLRFSDLLRRFALLTEVPKADPDSWDNLLYTYGMQLYGDMPLIEPLETCEKARVRALALVIDTSGSVVGEKLSAFLQRVFELLTAEDTFDYRTELHIIECDARVQRDTLIADKGQLGDFLRTLELHGGGGTDFRPAFRHIDDLRAQGQLRELRGILYLTDGEGTYPDSPPPCDTAFLFVDREDLSARVPPWAMRVLLDEASFDRPEIMYYQD